MPTTTPTTMPATTTTTTTPSNTTVKPTTTKTTTPTTTTTTPTTTTTTPKPTTSTSDPVFIDTTVSTVPVSSSFSSRTTIETPLASPTKDSSKRNGSDIYTTDGRGDPTPNPTAATQTTTINDKHTMTTDRHGTVTQAPLYPSTSGSGGSGGSGGSSTNDWVPGWGIALLVLAAVILLLLIIIFIMMVVRWCCKRPEKDYMDTTEDPYYNQNKQPPQESLPVYSPQSPVEKKPPSTPVIVGDTPKKNRTGFYAVNP
ncbi:cell wall integrity and stress response component 3-like isoform X2 [Myripristis murdjan]|uniref:cell wall integrity and stress response component 3-like isoform X2 n=1 Tax=Myripristis murdjan TaxID=586833 RepID=UPI0011762776|nr:cell wall integrity and stress response component 3-like isoform X2 [Myripristis murdjan]